MKRLLSLSLLLLSLACYPKSKISICGYTTFLDNPDTVMVHFKDESYKKVSIEDFRANYIYKPLPIGPNTTVVSGGISASFRCVHGRIRFVSSPSAADYVARKVNQPQHADVEVTFVNNAGDANNCGEWFITKGDVDYTVYLASPGELPEPDFTVYFNR